MSTVSAVVPVKDGERYLPELLDALAREGADEVLVIDSGSRDGSVAIAREAGVDVLEIPPESFGHGRTRNLGAERAHGDLIWFLTQDATPAPGSLAAYRAVFAGHPDLGAAFGPHLPRPDTSPMIARELVEFFATFSPADAPPRVFEPGDPTFLSNVNAVYRRECWAELRFAEVAYSEDQAFGRAIAAHPRWRKAYVPAAGVLHAHDYPPGEFMRRYFDEYRGLHETIGHVEILGVRSLARHMRASVGGDRRWMAAQGYGAAEQARWIGRSAVHHGGRKVFSALGSRAHRLPAAVQRRLSLEGRAVQDAPPPAAPAADSRPERRPVPVAATTPAHEYEGIARVLHGGPAPLLDPVPDMADRERLHIAFVIPPFRIGSGGHNIIFQLALRLERAGHTCSIWVHDPFGERRGEWEGVMRRTIVEHFAPLEAPVFKGFDSWFGADVVVATGWNTVFPVLELPGCRARAYLMNDHEPEFFATSVESIWASMTYGLGLHGICGSPWLRDLFVERYGGHAGVFEYGVDHDVYHPRPTPRRRDTVLFYARSVTPRRAVALGVLALTEVKRRRGDAVRIVQFGDLDPMFAPYDYEHLGIASPQELSWAYSEGTVGVCLSLTNYSLIPQEMLACGLPCVDLDFASPRSVFGEDGPVRLVPFDAHALADGIEALLDDRAEWEARSAAGLEFTRAHTWDAAAEQVHAQLREALRLRERGVA